MKKGIQPEDCSTDDGEVAICLTDTLYDAVKKAVVTAKQGTGSPCSTDSVTVCLGFTEALLLATGEDPWPKLAALALRGDEHLLSALFETWRLLHASGSR